jgi:hypothetical protein
VLGRLPCGGIDFTANSTARRRLGVFKMASSGTSTSTYHDCSIVTFGLPVIVGEVEAVSPYICGGNDVILISAAWMRLEVNKMANSGTSTQTQ